MVRDGGIGKYKQWKWRIRVRLILLYASSLMVFRRAFHSNYTFTLDYVIETYFYIHILMRRLASNKTAHHHLLLTASLSLSLFFFLANIFVTVRLDGAVCYDLSALTFSINILIITYSTLITHRRNQLQFVDWQPSTWVPIGDCILLCESFHIMSCVIEEDKHRINHSCGSAFATSKMNFKYRNNDFWRHSKS